MAATTKRLVCLTVLVTGVAARGDLIPSFHGLGQFPGGSDSSYARDISADGTVVVGYGKATGLASAWEAFRWTAATGMRSMNPAPGSYDSWAHGVSADGSVAVGGTYGRTGSFHEAFRWTAGGGIAGLSDLAGGQFYSRADGVSPDGSVVVGTGTSGSGREAFRWTQGTGMVGLGDLSGGSFQSGATAVSGAGPIVGTGQSGTGVEATLWTGGGSMTPAGLGDLSGMGYYSVATAITPDGTVIVGFAFSGTVLEAFRLKVGGSMVGLGLPAGAGPYSYAFGVSNDGAVVVGKAGRNDYPEASDRAVIWDAAHGMRKLQDVLVNECGLDLTGWTLTEARAFSGDGKAITGTGINPAGKSEAWVAVIPEPASVALLVLGGLALLRRRGVRGRG